MICACACALCADPALLRRPRTVPKLHAPVQGPCRPGGMPRRASLALLLLALAAAASAHTPGCVLRGAGCCRSAPLPAPGARAQRRSRAQRRAAAAAAPGRGRARRPSGAARRKFEHAGRGHMTCAVRPLTRLPRSPQLRQRQLRVLRGRAVHAVHRRRPGAPGAPLRHARRCALPLRRQPLTPGARRLRTRRARRRATGRPSSAT